MKKELLKNEMPKAVPYIIGNEAAERFSFYGIRSVMSTFLVAQFFNHAMNPMLQDVAEARSNEMVHLFVTLAYFMPLIGGIIADYFFGKYKVILYVSIFYAFGNLLLAFSAHNITFFTIGLVVIATAAGGIKSCVSANVGDQFDSSNQHLLSKIYSWFYFAINTGSVASTILIPLVYNIYGAEFAFGIPSILMCAATLIFWLGRKKYVRVPPSGIKKENFISITGYAILQIFSNRNGMGVWEATGKKFTVASIDGVKAVYRIIMVFSFTPIFWAMWDQNLAEWVLQAKNLTLPFLGTRLLPNKYKHLTRYS